jgi:hypothetical protein
VDPESGPLVVKSDSLPNPSRLDVLPVLESKGSQIISGVPLIESSWSSDSSLCVAAYLSILQDEG